MNFTLPNLNNNSTEEFIARIKAAPEDTTSLNFQNNDLSLRSTWELTRIFGSVSKLGFVNELDLSNTGLFDNKTSCDYAQFLAFIPLGITTLHLDKNSLENKTVYEITHLLSATPSKVSTLTLRNTNIFKNKKTTESVRCLSAIGENIKHLDLTYTNLEDKKSRDIEKIVAAIPKTVETLNVECIGGFKAATSVKSMLIINAEVQRLQKYIDAHPKLIAFASLQDILRNKENNEALFTQQVENWKNMYLPTFNHQRNRLHAFFAPKHKTESLLMLEKVFAILEISLEVKEPSTPQESFEPSV